MRLRRDFAIVGNARYQHGHGISTVAIEIVGIFKMGPFRQNDGCAKQTVVYNLREN
jgi:hypothetical protein